MPNDKENEAIKGIAEDEAKKDEAVKKILEETEEIAKKKSQARALCHRMGKFYISRFTLETNPHEVMMIMGQCIIFRAEHLLHAEKIEYIAQSLEFDPLNLGEAIPEYVWQMTEGKCIAIQSGGAATTPPREDKEAGVEKA